MSKYHAISEKILKLNVGGTFYTTSKSTVTKVHGSYMWRIFTGDAPCPRDERGSFFLDRDGPAFRHILNYMRSNKLVIPHGYKDLDLLRVEADFFGIDTLVEEIDNYLALRRRKRRPRPRKKTSQSTSELHRVHERNGDLYISDDGSDWFYD